MGTVTWPWAERFPPLSACQRRKNNTRPIDSASPWCPRLARQLCVCLPWPPARRDCERLVVGVEGAGGPRGWAAPAVPQEAGTWAPDLDLGRGSVRPLRSLPLAPGQTPCPPTWAGQCFFPGPEPLCRELWGRGWGWAGARCARRTRKPPVNLVETFQTPTFYSFVKKNITFGSLESKQRDTNEKNSSPFSSPF